MIGNLNAGKKLSELYPRTRRRLEFIKLFATGSIIDFGAGDGMIQEYIESEDYLGIEPDKTQLGKNPHIIYGDIYTYKSNIKYDTVMCIGVLPHLENIGLAIDILKSFMKEDGTLILSVANAYSINRIIKPQIFLEEDYHISLFDEIHLTNLLNDKDLRIIHQYNIPNLLLSRICTLFNPRLCDDIVVVCRKGIYK